MQGPAEAHTLQLGNHLVELNAANIAASPGHLDCQELKTFVTRSPKSKPYSTGIDVVQDGMSASAGEEASNDELEVDDRSTHSNGWLIPAACLTMLTMALVCDAKVWMETGPPAIEVAGLHLRDAEVF